MSQVVPLWERPGLRAAAGETLRPGGLALTDRAAETVGVLPGWPVLDVGCGVGATMRRLRSRYGATAYGIEPSAGQVACCGIGTGVVRARGESLPFGDGSFRAVFSECVLSLLPDPAAGVAEWSRVLSPGGYLAISDLYAPGEPVAGGASCADGALSLDRNRTMVISAGFSIVLLEDHSRLLRDLAARLLMAGEPACAGRSGLGYYLLVARKEDASCLTKAD